MSGYRDISVPELDRLLQLGSVRLLDVRTDVEIAQGMIPQGEPLPLHLIPLRLAYMDRNVPTVFYCRSGARSAQAAAFVAGNGFAEVYNLQGGIIAWASAGLPLA